MSRKHIAGLALLFIICLLSSAAHGSNGVVFGPQDMEVGRWQRHLSWHKFYVDDEGDGIIEIFKNSPEQQFKRGFIFFNRIKINLYSFLD